MPEINPTLPACPARYHRRVFMPRGIQSWGKMSINYDGTRVNFNPSDIIEIALYGGKIDIWIRLQNGRDYDTILNVRITGHKAQVIASELVSPYDDFQTMPEFCYTTGKAMGAN